MGNHFVIMTSCFGIKQLKWRTWTKLLLILRVFSLGVFKIYQISIIQRSVSCFFSVLFFINLSQNAYCFPIPFHRETVTKSIEGQQEGLRHRPPLLVSTKRKVAPYNCCAKLYKDLAKLIDINSDKIFSLIYI